MLYCHCWMNALWENLYNVSHGRSVGVRWEESPRLSAPLSLSLLAPRYHPLFHTSNDHGMDTQPYPTIAFFNPIQT